MTRVMNRRKEGVWIGRIRVVKQYLAVASNGISYLHYLFGQVRVLRDSNFVLKTTY